MIVKKRKTCCPLHVPFSKMEWEGEVVIEQICLDSVRIKEKMKEIVDENILNEDLKVKLISFIEEKNNFHLQNWLITIT